MIRDSVVIHWKTYRSLVPKFSVASRRDPTVDWRIRGELLDPASLGILPTRADFDLTQRRPQIEFASSLQTGKIDALVAAPSAPFISDVANPLCKRKQSKMTNSARARLLTLEGGRMQHRSGDCFVVAVTGLELGDSQESPSSSALRLFEDGVELGPGHTTHAEIESKGAGRFSHWIDHLYFSSSDATSPLSNGRLYQALAMPVANQGETASFPVSSLPLGALLNLQRGIMAYQYKGIDCFKCPFDLALYQRLIWEQRPRTIIEFGSWRGGSALWFADLLTTYGIDGHIYSFDIAGNPTWEDPRISFRYGDVLRIAEAAPADWVSSLPRPLLVMDDAGHFRDMTASVLRHFAPLMRSGEYIVIEDTIIHEMQSDAQYDGGPRRAVQDFLEEDANFFVDFELCNYYGTNVTWNVNGYLRRR